MKAKSSFIWSQRGIELDSVASVELNLSLVIFPNDSELDYSFRNRTNRKSLLVLGILLEEGAILKSGRELCVESISSAFLLVEAINAVTFICLLEFGLGGKIRHDHNSSNFT